jgi:hypothetical protein
MGKDFRLSRKREKIMPRHVPTSCGDLLDRITILLLKIRYIRNPTKIHFVLKELAAIFPMINDTNYTKDLSKISLEWTLLYNINETLWDLEETIRSDLNNEDDFEPEHFINLIKQIHQYNTERALIKSKINEKANDSFLEIKDYTTTIE